MSFRRKEEIHNKIDNEINRLTKNSVEDILKLAKEMQAVLDEYAEAENFDDLEKYYKQADRFTRLVSNENNRVTESLAKVRDYESERKELNK